MPTNETEDDVSKQVPVKLVLLGETGVGKSSLVLRYVKRKFSETPEATVGAVFLTKAVKLPDCTVKFEIWDTAGQERYHSLAPMYYRGAQAAIIVFDVTRKDSYLKAQNWLAELHREVGHNIVIAIAGNKMDQDGRQVSSEEAQQYATEHGAFFMDTSAKTDYNVTKLFETIAQKVPKTVARPRNSLPVLRPQSTAAQSPPSAGSGGKCC